MAKLAKKPRLGLQQLDNYNIDARLMRQIDKLLTQLESHKGVSLKDRHMALSAIARIQVAYAKTFAKDEENVGSSVRKYTAAFASNAARGRAAVSGPAAAPAAVDDRDDFTLDPDEDPAA